MKVVITLEFRFTRTPDGQVWTRTTYSLPFWNRYLAVFDGVKIVARAEHQASVDERYRPVLGPGIEFREVPYYHGPAHYLKVRGRLRAALRSYVGVDDAVLCRVASPIASDLLPGLWRSGRPYGLEVVGDPYDTFAPGAVKHPMRPIFRYLLTRSLRRQCSRAAGVSYVTEHALQRRYPARAEMTVGVSDADLQSTSFTAEPRIFTTSYSSAELTGEDYAPRPKQYSSPVYPRLVYVGSMEQMYKGQDVLIRAVRLLTERHCAVELMMIGDGKHRSELEQLTRELSLSDRIRFLGELPAGAAIKSEFDKAALLVLPSRTEGLPRVIVEAMAHGLPCIASDVGGIPELLHPDDLVPADNPDALADKLQEVLSSPARLTQMSARNLQRAQQFRPEVLERKRTEFYKFLRERTELWLASQTSHSAALAPAELVSR